MKNKADEYLDMMEVIAQIEVDGEQDNGRLAAVAIIRAEISYLRKDNARLQQINVRKKMKRSEENNGQLPESKQIWEGVDLVIILPLSSKITGTVEGLPVRECFGRFESLEECGLPEWMKLVLMQRMYKKDDLVLACRREIAEPVPGKAVIYNFSIMIYESDENKVTWVTIDIDSKELERRMMNELNEKKLSLKDGQKGAEKTEG